MRQREPSGAFVKRRDGTGGRRKSSTIEMREAAFRLILFTEFLCSAGTAARPISLGISGARLRCDVGRTVASREEGASQRLAPLRRKVQRAGGERDQNSLPRIAGLDPLDQLVANPFASFDVA